LLPSVPFSTNSNNPKPQEESAMSRTRHLIDPKVALTILGLAASAAFYTHDAVAEVTRGPEHALVRQHSHTRGNPDAAYALVRDTDRGTNMSGDSASWKDIEVAKRSISGDFLWFRDGGKAYVVQDPQVVAKARAAWAPVDRLGVQMDGYGKQMEQHGKAMEALGKEMGSAAARMRFASMEEIGGRMKEAGKPMEALGKKMDVLGKEMERESHTADATTRELIRDAQAKGLARQAPAQG
jgi:hypothetical protein